MLPYESYICPHNDILVPITSLCIHWIHNFQSSYASKTKNIGQTSCLEENPDEEHDANGDENDADDVTEDEYDVDDANEDENDANDVAEDESTYENEDT